MGLLSGPADLFVSSEESCLLASEMVMSTVVSSGRLRVYSTYFESLQQRQNKIAHEIA